MLSEQEKQGCSEILELLCDEDLFSLMNTATNRVVSTKNRKEATSAILQFTLSIKEFFRRRKINKDLLLKYIFLQSWPVSKDKDLDDIQKIIVDKWRERKCQSTALGVLPQRVKEPLQLAEGAAMSGVMCTQVNNFNNNQYVHNNTVNNTVVNVNVLTLPMTPESLAESQEYQNAVNFVNWFYSLLNSLNPEMGPQREFGPQHFWNDVQMMLEIKTRGQHVTETLYGSEIVARKLLSFPVSERLLFCSSPSKDTINIKSDNSGKKVIMACGELHARGMKVGYFCQSFGLVPHPMAINSCKVKMTLLKMSDMPNLKISLMEDKDAPVMEGLTVSAIQGLL